jgi:hypothetical protein
LIAGKCNISWGGRGVEKSNYEVLVGSGHWGPPNSGFSGALVGGHEANGSDLHLCRATWQHYLVLRGTHPGKLVSGKCNVEFGGEEIEFTTFEVFYLD